MTADSGVSDMQADHVLTMRLCPVGPELANARSRRAADVALVTDIGSDPDGSSLTVCYRRSRGSGAEKGRTNLLRVLATMSVPSTFSRRSR